MGSVRVRRLGSVAVIVMSSCVVGAALGTASA